MTMHMFPPVARSATLLTDVVRQDVIIDLHLKPISSLGVLPNTTPSYVSLQSFDVTRA